MSVKCVMPDKEEDQRKHEAAENGDR